MTARRRSPGARPPSQAQKKGRRGAGSSSRGKRPRRAAGETQREILDAAQRRLAEGGPEAVRLQDIARDVGISHPAILHHFGSREGLMAALEDHVTGALTAEVGRVLLRGGTEAGSSAADLIESVARAMDEGGLARLVAWWLLREQGEPGPSGEARRIVTRVVELIRTRLAEDAGSDARRVPSREEVAFAVRLAVLALFGDALFGDELAQRPVAERDAEGARFRRWLSELLTERMARGRGD